MRLINVHKAGATPGIGYGSHWEFDGISDLMEYAGDGHPKKWHPDRPSSWNRNTSYPQACQYIKTGWAEGREQVVKQFSGLLKSDRYEREEYYRVSDPPLSESCRTTVTPGW